MNEEQHIIKFKCDVDIEDIFFNNDFYISIYSWSKERFSYYINIKIYYNNLNIYNLLYSNNIFDYIFNLSNMLYKLHTKDYYSKIYRNKGLI